MNTMIFINNDVIQIVNPIGKRYQYESIPLREGTILNGVMIDTDEVVQKLKQHRRKLQNATLVVDSSHIIVKKMQLPKLPKKRLFSIVKSEFNLGEEQEYVYDLNILSSSHTEVCALGCAVPKEFIEKYHAVFKEANIRLKRVDVAMNGIVKYVNKIPAFQNKTFILNIVSGNVLLALLFENGEYKISNRHRMIQEMGTEGYLRELHDKFSTMVQFSQSQRIENVKDSYYIGIDKESMSSYIQSAKEIDPSINIEAFTDDKKDMKYIYPFLGMLVNKEDINFKNIYKIVSKKRKVNKGLVFKVLFILVLLAGIVLYTRQLSRNNAVDKNELNVLQTYITKKEAAKQKEEETVEKSIVVSSQITQYSWVIENIENYRRISPEMLKHIYEQKIVIEHLSYGNNKGSMVLEGYGSSKDAVAEYSAVLRDKRYADQQHYSGYSVIPDDAKSTYAFQIESVWNKVESEVVLNEENE